MNGIETMIVNVLKAFKIDPAQMRADIEEKLTQFENVFKSLDANIGDIHANQKAMKEQMEFMAFHFANRLGTIERALLSDVIAGEIPLAHDPDLKPQPMELTNGETESQDTGRRRSRN